MPLFASIGPGVFLSFLPGPKKFHAYASDVRFHVSMLFSLMHSALPHFYMRCSFCEMTFLFMYIS